MANSKVFSMAVYNKLLRTFSLLKKGLLFLRREGFRHFFSKTVSYLSSNNFFAVLGLTEVNYDKWIKKNQLTNEMIEKIKKDVIRFEYKPKISIIMPVYNVGQIWLEKAIVSVLNQLYENWELCIADDGSTEDHIKKILDEHAKHDKRIRVKYLPENKGIANASNEALSFATGEFIGLLDNDDEISLDALYEVVKELNAHREVDFIYSDEDKITEKGVRHNPFFKPDWSPDMLRSYNYICHFAVIRKKIVEDLQGFREEYEGSQDYDLFLRVVEQTQNVVHIPKVLYHWRAIEGSVAKFSDAKMYAYDSAKRALTDHIHRLELDGTVENGKFLGSYRIQYRITNDPKISIIIPSKDKVSMLKRCVDSILHRTSYNNYFVFIVDNGSVENETLKYYDSIRLNQKMTVLNYHKPFNFSAINNFAVEKICSECIIFLNNDTEVISPDWIETMLEFSQRKDVGAVGAQLYYPNDTVQHGGIILGIGGVAGHQHKTSKRNSMGYFGRLKVIQNMSAVTAACLMTKKTIFKEIGGFDETYAYAFNDVDLCLKMREREYLIVYTPYAELYHYESVSRGYDDTPEKHARLKREAEYFQQKWMHVLAKGDPYYNPNLTLDKEDFSIKI